MLVAFALTAYLGFIGFFIYFCMFADPDTSPMAEFLTETLPQKSWALVQRSLGKKGSKVVEWIADRFMILIYIVVVFGSWSIIFFYVYPWISSQTYVGQYHKIVGYFVFGSCVLSWQYASNSSPGIITKDTLSLYDHFPYDDLMFVAGKKCPTRKIPRLARSKFDRYKYGENVPRFDHFCGWLYNTVGEENYRWFLLFLAVHVGMCLYGSVVLYFLFYGEIREKKLLEVTFFNRATGAEVGPGDYFFVAQFLFHKFFVEAGVLVLMSVMVFALGGFLGYHAWITSKGLTTNETFKWDEIQKWYKIELKKYQQAIKDGTIVEGEKATPPTVSDGDVTCTPGASSQPSNSQTVDSEDEPIIRDPGPPPKNIYNRGFVENWKEVIFPISLRKRKQTKKKKAN